MIGITSTISGITRVFLEKNQKKQGKFLGRFIDAARGCCKMECGRVAQNVVLVFLPTTTSGTGFEMQTQKLSVCN
jgi:hypothetical protein